jgi:hypothetical protein
MVGEAVRVVYMARPLGEAVMVHARAVADHVRPLVCIDVRPVSHAPRIAAEAARNLFGEAEFSCSQSLETMPKRPMPKRPMPKRPMPKRPMPKRPMQSGQRTDVVAVGQLDEVVLGAVAQQVRPAVAVDVVQLHNAVHAPCRVDDHLCTWHAAVRHQAIRMVAHLLVADHVCLAVRIDIGPRDRYPEIRRLRAPRLEDEVHPREVPRALGYPQRVEAHRRVAELINQSVAVHVRILHDGADLEAPVLRHEDRRAEHHRSGIRDIDPEPMRAG